MRPLRTIALFAAAAALALGGASSASAAPPALPPGGQLVSISCNTDDTPVATLAVVDAATGIATALGPTADPTFECGYSAAWDASTGTLYGVIYDDVATLVRWDVASQTLVSVGLVEDGIGAGVAVDSIAIDLDGNAYVVSGDTLFSIDLASGLATSLGVLAGDGLSDNAYGFSVDPVTGDLYLLSEQGDLYELDPDAVSTAYLASWTFSPDQIFTRGLAIDANGTAWVVQDAGVSNSLLSSVPLAGFGDTPEFSGSLELDGAYLSWWVAYVPASLTPPAPVEPTLASTGLEIGASWVLAAVAAGAGIAILVVAGRRRRA